MKKKYAIFLDIGYKMNSQNWEVIMEDNKLLKEIYDKIQSIDNRMDAMENKMDAMEKQMNGMQNSINGMNEDIKKLNDKTDRIEIILENETNPNIDVIAEGHLDLVRKLEEATAISKDKETIKMRVNALEREVKIIKIALNIK